MASPEAHGATAEAGPVVGAAEVALDHDVAGVGQGRLPEELGPRHRTAGLQRSEAPPRGAVDPTVDAKAPVENGAYPEIAKSGLARVTRGARAAVDPGEVDREGADQSTKPRPAEVAPEGNAGMTERAEVAPKGRQVVADQERKVDQSPAVLPNASRIKLKRMTRTQRRQRKKTKQRQQRRKTRTRATGK